MIPVPEAAAGCPLRSLSRIERNRYSYRLLSQSVPIAECGEELVPVRPSPRHRLQVQPFWQDAGDLEGSAYRRYISRHPTFTLAVRRTVLQRLHQASRQLPPSWQLRVRASYRPLSVQYELLAKLCAKILAEHPQLTPERVLEQARLYVSDPALLCPPHTTGAAVDIDVFDSAANRLVAMGCRVNTDSPLAFTHARNISAAARQNRVILLNAMLQAGFANLTHEWWHFSYGDQYWAAFYGKDAALYNMISEEKDILDL